MEQKRRPLRKKKKNPLIQFLPYIIIVIIAAVLIVAVIVITDKKDEERGKTAQETQAEQTGAIQDGSGQNQEGSMQVLTLTEGADAEDQENGETQSAGELDTNQKILNLIPTYFQAEEEGDADTLNQIVDTPNPVTEEHLQQINEIIMDYQNIICYVIDGLDDSSWVTYISYDIKFLNVDQTAPSLDRFIIRQRDDGTMYIDMHPVDEDMNTYLEEVRNRSDVRQLYTDVNNRYIQACNSSEELSDLVDMLNRGSLEMYEQEETGGTEESGEETAADSVGDTEEETAEE